MSSLDSGHSAIVPRQIYLDHQASTPCDPKVVEAMLPYLVDCCGNPSSTTHREGQRAAAAVREARERVAAAIRSSAAEVVFTSGATESNNLAILGAARGSPRRRKIVVSAVEHKCVLNAARSLTRSGRAVHVVPVLSDGTVDVGALVDIVDHDTALVSIQAANNEIGTTQRVQELAQIAHRVGAVFHCDAAQALGQMAIDLEDWDVDLLSLSAHKAYGPKGVGALVIRGGASNAPLEPLFFGGAQEDGLRPGTINVPGVVGFGLAAELAADYLPTQSVRIRRLRDELERRLMSSIDGVRGNGARTNRLPGSSSLTFSGCDADALIARLPEFAISAGAACSSGTIEPSHVLLAIGLDRQEVNQTIRVGLGRRSSEGEVAHFADRLRAAVIAIRALELIDAESPR